MQTQSSVTRAEAATGPAVSPPPWARKEECAKDSFAVPRPSLGAGPWRALALHGEGTA